jgi:hypothetical protein
MAVQHRDEALRERSGPTVPQSALAALTGVLNATMEETLPQEAGTGSVSWNAVCVLHVCPFLNHEELMEREARVQKPSKQTPPSARRNHLPGEQLSQWFLLFSASLSASNSPDAAVCPSSWTPGWSGAGARACLHGSCKSRWCLGSAGAGQACYNYRSLCTVARSGYYRCLRSVRGALACLSTRIGSCIVTVLIHRRCCGSGKSRM